MNQGLENKRKRETVLEEEETVSSTGERKRSDVLK